MVGGAAPRNCVCHCWYVILTNRFLFVPLLDYELGDFVMAMDETAKSLTEDLTGKGAFFRSHSFT